MKRTDWHVSYPEPDGEDHVEALKLLSGIELYIRVGRRTAFHATFPLVLKYTATLS